MKNQLKIKIITSIIFIIIGTLLLGYVILNNKEWGSRECFFVSFACSLIATAIMILWKSKTGLLNPEKLKDIENMSTDERIKMLKSKAMSITFTFSILLEAFATIVFAIKDQMPLAQILGTIMIIQLLFFVVTYKILQIRN